MPETWTLYDRFGDEITVIAWASFPADVERFELDQSEVARVLDWVLPNSGAGEPGARRMLLQMAGVSGQDANRLRNSELKKRLLATVLGPRGRLAMIRAGARPKQKFSAGTKTEPPPPPPNSPAPAPRAPRPEAPQEKKPPPTKRYYHVGMRFAVAQYNIAGRKMQLELPMRSNSALRDMDAFHALAGSVFAATDAEDTPRSPGKLYALGGAPGSPDHYEADLACATQLIVEDGVEHYQKGGKQGGFNEHLGKGIGMHLGRTKTLRVNGSGNFHASDLRLVPGMAETEKMCLKVYAYLRAKVDGGTPKIYEIVDGQLGAVVDEKEYVKRKRIEANVHTDKEGGAMPFIPGVYQVHALLESTAEGSFTLVEVYCDGDCIYPE